MFELYTAIPDPDAVLALEPEELGAKILFMLRQRSGSFSPYNCVLEANNGIPGQPGYPPDQRRHVAAAVSEAFAWLSAQGLIIPEPGNTGGWMILSRRARRFESESDFQ